MATGDYSGIYAVPQYLVDLGVAEIAAPGLLSKTDKVQLTDVTDGLSNTIYLTESAGKPNVYLNGKLVGTAPAVRVNGGGWARPASDIPRLLGLAQDGFSDGPGGINVVNGIAQTAYPDPAFGTDGTGQIYSFHTGGTNALFGDGSVRYIKQTVSLRTLAALITRNGGEVVGDF